MLEINSLSLNIPEGIPVSPEWISIINPIIKFVKLFTGKEK